MVSAPNNPQAKMRRALRFAEENPDAPRKKIVFESRHALHCASPGVSYPSFLGQITVLSITDSEVCYFQAGFVYFLERQIFVDLLKSQSFDGLNSGDKAPGTRVLTEMEVEFILGILATVGPQASWMFLGNDLTEFMALKRKKLPNWTADIASLFLARMILKRYATVLYQRLSGLHADVVWASLSEAVSTDDTAIYRFIGRLLGHYGSEELVDRAITRQQRIYSCIFKGLASLLDVTPGNEGSADGGQQARAKDLVSSLANLGIRISSADVWSLLEAISPCSHEIMKSIEMISPQFLDNTPALGFC
ncbi:MAG TPA: hypothetical protein DCZ69_17090 [Syntrophobacteraceae bacterium]|nr:hypothetical protein [Syntrophobacteraceae bacterium]